MKTYLFTAALFYLPLLCCHTEPRVALSSGSYSLSFTGLSFTDGSGVNEKDITLTAILKTHDSDVVIETHGVDGKPIKMSGRIRGANLYLWFSDSEAGNGDEQRIVTFHLTGKIVDDHSASGEASIFGSHEKAGGGKWILAKAK